MMYVHLYGDQTIAEAPDTLCSLTELVLNINRGTKRLIGSTRSYNIHLIIENNS